jgi:hypothetical protein
VGVPRIQKHVFLCKALPELMHRNGFAAKSCNIFATTAVAELSINLPTMANRQQMHLVPCDINCVDNSVITHAQTEVIAARKPIMREFR